MRHFQVPATINRYLRDYQRNGVRFLYKHYCDGHGAILADDMGLGKTVQVSSVLTEHNCSELSYFGSDLSLLNTFDSRMFKQAIDVTSIERYD